VPRLLGLAAVLADPQQFALDLPEIPNTPVFTTVELDSQIDLAVAAELAGIELAELQALNPGFNQWATDPDGPHRLQLPVAAADTFASPSPICLPMSASAGIATRSARATRSAASRVDTARRSTCCSPSTDCPARRFVSARHLMVPTSTRSIAEYPLSADNRLASTQARTRGPRAHRTHGGQRRVPVDDRPPPWRGGT
jgi:membrane-bound lytic murein transglycosylase D